MQNSQLIKSEKRRRILVMLSFRELCDTKLSGFLSFDSTATSLNQKKGEN